MNQPVMEQELLDCYRLLTPENKRRALAAMSVAADSARNTVDAPAKAQNPPAAIGADRREQDSGERKRASG